MNVLFPIGVLGLVVPGYAFYKADPKNWQQVRSGDNLLELYFLPP